MTKQKVGEEVRKLVKSWNAEYAEKPNVSQQQEQFFFSPDTDIVYFLKRN